MNSIFRFLRDDQGQDHLGRPGVQQKNPRTVQPRQWRIHIPDSRPPLEDAPRLEHEAVSSGQLIRTHQIGAQRCAVQETGRVQAGHHAGDRLGREHFERSQVVDRQVTHGMLAVQALPDLRAHAVRQLEVPGDEVRVQMGEKHVPNLATDTRGRLQIDVHIALGVNDGIGARLWSARTRDALARLPA